MEIKPEVNDNSCKMEIDNNVVGDGLRDIFTKNIKEEPKIESINDSFDYLDLQEYHVKTEIEQDEHKLIPRNLILFEEKQTNDKELPSSELDSFMSSGSEYFPSNKVKDENFMENGKHDDNWQQTIVEQGMKPKTHIQNEAAWKRNINKKKRYSGLEYKTQSGKVVSPKVFEIVTCLCKNRCHLLIPEARQLELYLNFYAMENFNLQTAYLFSLIKVMTKLRSYTGNVNSRREKTRLYFLPDSSGKDQKVCKIFFQSIFQVSDGRLDRLLKNKNIGLPAPRDRRGKHPPYNKTSEEKQKQIKNFIERLASYESHYSRLKCSHTKYLSPNLSITNIYNLYREETENPASYFVFKNIFKTHNLHFHPPVTYSS